MTSQSTNEVMVCPCGNEHPAASWSGGFVAGAGRCTSCAASAHSALPTITDAEIDTIAERMPGGPGGFLKQWGYRQFARDILALRTAPEWEPTFDCMEPEQEALVVQFCEEIAGAKGQPGRRPDPVRLLEMAEQLYGAERKAVKCLGSKAHVHSGEMSAEGKADTLQLVMREILDSKRPPKHCPDILEISADELRRILAQHLPHSDLPAGRLPTAP